MYAMIISPVNEVEDEARALFNGISADAAIDYLAQWDMGRDSEYDLTEEIEYVRLARNYFKDDYVLVEHPLYMALYRKIED